MDNSSSKERCCSIDWLEVYVLESPARWPMNADYYRQQGWHVIERDYGTRVYREMFTLLDTHDQPFIEVRRAPSQSADSKRFFEPYAAHLRLHNYACYATNPVADLSKFLLIQGYEFMKIYRLDICLDFERFDKGDDPAKVITRYMRGRLTKVNQSQVAVHGYDQWDGRQWNSLSWGQPKSMVSTKFYNKTKELADAKDKPYIRYRWFQYGLVDDPIKMTKTLKNGKTYTPTIWRVEFSIRSSASKWFVIDRSTGRKKRQQVMPHTLDMYMMQDQLITIFASLADQYFHFKIYEAGKRKDRCQDKVLFVWSSRDVVLQVDRNATHRPADKPLARFLVLVRSYRESVYDEETRRACDVIIHALESTQIRDFVADPYDRALIALIREQISMRVKDSTLPPINMPQLVQAAKELPELF